MVRKIFSILMGILLCFSIASCGIAKKDITRAEEQKMQNEALQKPLEKPKEKISNTVNNAVYTNTENLDNTLYSWGLRVLPNHQTPE
ncbi:MAG: peptidoglycan-N-acetylmuramic acid deacetylase, partial [Thermoanaerobacter sp.]|nr:peptidoglycan-N-acetylmuramic acid deacetylase [Thermoanaerobacter sp.]